MENKQTKPISCEDTEKILKALKEGNLNAEEIDLFKKSVFKKISRHIANCEKCLSLAEELGFGLLAETKEDK